ncbi:hypothetical protein M3Y99_01828400 [Aphelenchoides fujianensis]|nr:hypothetical protein M3Y99_01828400 [Aphelenchoides fujianensis]
MSEPAARACGAMRGPLDVCWRRRRRWMLVASLAALLTISAATPDFPQRPMRIRLVNYERRFLPRHVSTPPEEAARRLTKSVDGQTADGPLFVMTAAQQDEPIRTAVALGREARISGPFGGGGDRSFGGAGGDRPFGGGGGDRSRQFASASPARNYLQEVRRRMRAGGKIHTPSTALNLPHLSSVERTTRNWRARSGSDEIDGVSSSASREGGSSIRRVVPDARRVFAAPTIGVSSPAPLAVAIEELVDEEHEHEANSTAPSASPAPASHSSSPPSSPASMTASNPSVVNATAPPLHTSANTTGAGANATEIPPLPTKIRPVLPAEEIVPLDDDSAHPKNATLPPLDELEIKSDVVLQKSLQRTTIRTRTYRDRIVSTTPLPRAKAANNSGSTAGAPTFATLPPLFSALPADGALPLGGQPAAALPLPQILSAGGGGSFGPAAIAPPNVQPAPTPLQLPQADPLITSVPAAKAVESLEQLGCGFDLLSQQCKDVFVLGLCQQCVDVGNVFLHDCKCAVPTTLGRTANALFTPPTSTPLPGGGGGGASLGPPIVQAWPTRL